MAIITIARQVGSGGQSIARALAAELGYRVAGRAELGREAEALGVRLPRAFVEFADEEGLGTGPLDPGAPLYLSYGELEFDDALRGTGTPPEGVPEIGFLEGLARARRTILLAVQAVVYRLAARDGVVLIGAGAQLLLAGQPGVLRVKVVAPEEVRVVRLAETHGLSVPAARAAVRRADWEQREFNRAIFDADWDDALLWDLVVNTEHLEVEAVCRSVSALLQSPRQAAETVEPQRSALEAAGAINLRLLTDPRLADAWIFATPLLDGVALRGEAATPEDLAAAVACASAVVPTARLRNLVTQTGRIAAAPQPAADAEVEGVSTPA